MAGRKGDRAGSLGVWMGTRAPESLPFPGPGSCPSPALGCPLGALLLCPHQMHTGEPGNRLCSTAKVKHVGEILQNQMEHSAADVRRCTHCTS